MAYEGKIKIDPEIDMSKIRKQIAELTKAMKINAQIDTTVAQRQLAQLTDAIRGLNKSFAGGKSAATDFSSNAGKAFSALADSAATSFGKIVAAGFARLRSVICTKSRYVLENSRCHRAWA